MILIYPKVVMAVDNPTYENMVLSIGQAAGICYNVGTIHRQFDEVEEYVRKRLAAKHESILEHKSLSVEFTVDRGISHELVRHRLCSFTQSSTRYCDYISDRETGHCRFVIPPWLDIEQGTYEHQKIEGMNKAEAVWFESMMYAEQRYHELRKCHNWKPEQARSVLPNSLATRILVTANLRQWQHILCLRAVGTTGRPHPQMQEVMVPILKKFADLYPVFFAPLWKEIGDQELSNRVEVI